MVNSVNSYNYNSATVPSVYGTFKTPQNGYYLTSSTVVDKEEKSKKSHKLGLSIAGSTLILGFGVLALMKGMPKGLGKKLEGLHKYFEGKIAKLSEDAKTSGMARFYEYGLKKVESASEYLNSVNNATTFKDILFSKLLSKNKFTARAGAKISAFFERFSRQTVLSGYNSAHKRFNYMFEAFGAADNKIIAHNPDRVVTINGKTLTAKEWLKEIAAEKLDLSEAFNRNFGSKAVNKRYAQTKDVMKDLDKKVWNLSLGDVKENYKNKELYDTFLPQAILEKDKSELVNLVSGYRDILVGTQEKEVGLAKILKIYEQLLPADEFAQLTRVSNKAVKRLDKAVNFETDKFFDKLRDLKLGSAPTDVLSMVTGVGAVATGLTKAEDNDERISVTLKYGIPAIGTIATSLCLGAALISGGKAFVYSMLSGAVINKIGTKIDDYRKNKQDEKSGSNAV